MKSKYFDHNATTPPLPAALAAMEASHEEGFANAASVHDFGTKARYLVEKARHDIAALLNVAPECLFFTAGGTEADNIALYGALSRSDKGLVVCPKIEHPAVRLPIAHWAKVFGHEVRFVDAGDDGRVDPSVYEDATIGALMFANNESGAIQPVAEARKACKGFFHCDAVQSVGKVPVDFAALDIDSAALSAHKFYGPKGIGLLYLKEPKGFPPFVLGGSQEGGIRPGTMNVPGIVGMATALVEAIKNVEAESARLRGLRSLLLNQLEGLGVKFAVNGGLDECLPNTVNIWLEGQAAGDVVRRVANQGYGISAGAACASGTTEAVPSPVLLGMGLTPERAKQSVRISMGHANTEESVKGLAAAIAG
ncbi:MAG: cysteine desulfurase [Planctomycetes bacterium]|nr:cysteine desulfurase [Planctomycetota bacterium]